MWIDSLVSFHYIEKKEEQQKLVKLNKIFWKQESARAAASSATQLISSAHNANHHNTNKYSQVTPTGCDRGLIMIQLLVVHIKQF